MLRSPFDRTLHRLGAIAIGMPLAFVATAAHGNEGTIERHVMPIAATMAIALPRPAYYVADSGPRAAGIGLRASPVSFYAKRSWGELVFVPLTDLDVILGKEWPSSRVRLSTGLRTMYFPFDGAADLLGVVLDAGGSVGFGGPSGFVGSGLVVGGKMGTIGLVYRRASGREDSIHTFTLDIGLTYPIRLGPRG